MLIAPKEIKLKRYSTHSYIGLFIDEESASWFRNMMDAFASEAKTSGKGSNQKGCGLNVCDLVRGCDVT